jgi:hypothetical protein
MLAMFMKRKSQFNTIEVLRGHLQINSFLDSIVKKPPGFDVWVQRNKLKESNR